MSRKNRRHLTVVHGLANPERVRADQDRRRSGAAGFHKSAKDVGRRQVRQQLREGKWDG